VAAGRGKTWHLERSHGSLKEGCSTQQMIHGSLQQSHGCYSKHTAPSSSHTAATTKVITTGQQTQQVSGRLQKRHTSRRKSQQTTRRHGWQVAKKTLQRRPHQISEQQQE